MVKVASVRRADRRPAGSAGEYKIGAISNLRLVGCWPSRQRSFLRFSIMSAKRNFEWRNEWLPTARANREAVTASMFVACRRNSNTERRDHKKPVGFLGRPSSPNGFGTNCMRAIIHTGSPAGSHHSHPTEHDHTAVCLTLTLTWGRPFYSHDMSNQ